MFKICVVCAGLLGCSVPSYGPFTPNYRPFVEVWEPNDRLEFDQNERLLKETQSKSQWKKTFETAFKESNAGKALTWIELLAKGESPAAQSKSPAAVRRKRKSGILRLSH